jgi:hypothetical protein
MTYESLTDERAQELADEMEALLPEMGLNERDDGFVTYRTDITGSSTRTNREHEVTEFRIEGVIDVYIGEILRLLDDDEYVTSVSPHFDTGSVTMSVTTEVEKPEGVFL